MKLSFSTLGCPNWSFQDIITVASDMDYDGIEIRGVDKELNGSKIREFSQENAAATRQLLEEKELVLACLTSAAYLHDKNITDQVLKESCDYVDTAERMNIKYVRLLADYGPEQSGQLDADYIAAQLREIAQYAQPKGVDVLVETNGFFANSARMADLIDAVGEQNAGVLWDIHHPYRYFDESPAYTIDTIGDLVRHVHIKDSKYEGDTLKYTMMGYGNLPIKDCVSGLVDIGYEGYFSLEWLKRWDLSLEAPGIAFAAYASYMRNLL